jgi:Rieske Fe-S protein
MNPSLPKRKLHDAAFSNSPWAGWLPSSPSPASAAGAVRFLVPNVFFEPDQRFKAGKPEDYLDGSVTFLDDERVFLVRKGNTFRCLSAICTHLGCTVNRAGNGFHCPCHGSVFDDRVWSKAGRLRARWTGLP